MGVCYLSNVYYLLTLFFLLTLPTFLDIALFRNFSSIAMGGVARPSQILVAKMLEIERVTHARKAVADFYGKQRERYAKALTELGMEVKYADGGFYVWAKLPNGLNCTEYNRRLFKHKAAILPGSSCDMHRKGADGIHDKYIRFSFGPLKADSFENDIEILKACLSE